jgi:hypothetical protein
MATPANLNFTEFTDPRVLWVNVQAVNTFFNSITVSVSGENIPAATLTELGGVKQMALTAFNPPVANATYVTINLDDGSAPVDIPSHDAFVDLKTRVDYLATYITALKAQLDAKGYTG